ncbi:MAG: NifU family protein [Candidatus Cyclobacteriaceae bacterium M3_2C_046]
MDTYDKEKLYSRQVHLYLESNPNPNSLKFVANFMLVEEGKSYDFPDQESAHNAPLAQELFNFPFVDRVFYMSNFVTVTKKESVEWDEIQNTLKEYIKQYLQEEKPILNLQDTEQDQTDETEDSEVEVKIKGILDEYIKPAVEQDGGAISFKSFDDGVVKVLLQGSCSGCPSSIITLKAGIENLLKRFIPEVKAVEAEGE